MTADERFIYQALDPDEEIEGVRSEIITGPVSDWATDFSHLEPEWAALLTRVAGALAGAGTEKAHTGGRR